MKEKKVQMNMGTEPVRSLLFKLGIPIMLGMLFTALDNIGDAFFVSKLGVNPLSAILICGPIGQVIVALGLLFGNGAGAYIPRLLGAKSFDKANKVASTALFGSLLLGVAATVFIFADLTPILRLLGGTAGNMRYALRYARIYVPSLLLNIFTVTMNSINSSEGRARLVLAVNSMTAVLNFVLNPVCIFAFHMGIAGAAWATVIAQTLATLLLLWKMRKSIFSFRLRNISLTGEILAPVLQIGCSTLIFQFLTSMATTLTNVRAKAYGDSVIAGMGAVIRICSLGSMMVFGFIKGFQSVAGYNYGAGKYERLRESIRTSVLWSTAFCVCFGILMVLFPAHILSLFATGDARMLVIGTKALRAAGISFVCFGFYTVYSSLFLAMGKTKAGFLLGACRQGFCFLPVIWLLPALAGLGGILYAQPIADVFSAVIAVCMAVSLHRKLGTQEEKRTRDTRMSA